jgi:biotin carboxyl carrier protein
VEVRNTWTTATVADFACDDGVHLEADDRILSLESMKTLHEVHAPQAGIVRLHVRLGQVVNEGDVLATMLDS